MAAPYVPAPAGPTAHDGRVLQAIGPSDWSAHEARPRWAPPTFAGGARVSFSLPINASDLFLVTRGARQAGKVRIETGAPGTDVRVDVRVAYRNQQALASVSVCRLRKSGSRYGLAVFTPTVAHDNLYFELLLTFPAAPNPVHVRGLTAHTSNYAYEIADLWQSPVLDHVDIHTANAPIHAHSMTLHGGQLASSNGPIVGHFNASDALVLTTSNAPIDITASLFSTASTRATSLTLHTSNGPITSSVSLAAESGPGRFEVTARSSNAAVAVRYDEAPVGARLASDVRTSNSPASVAMHPAYEGAFDLSTSNAQPLVRDTRPQDPSGAARRRVLRQTRTRTAISGTVYWEGSGQRGNTCTVHTSNAGASLAL